MLGRRIAVVLVLALFAGLQPARAAIDGNSVVAAALYDASATKVAAQKSADALLRADQQRIAKLETAVKAGNAKLVELTAAKEQFVRQLAEKDRAYAEAIAAFRNAVTDIAATPQELAALALFNTGDEAGALAILDRLRAANDAARTIKANIESAAEDRRIATIALEARDRGKVSTASVIVRFEEVTRRDPGVFWDWVTLGRLYQDAGRLTDAARAAGQAAATATSDRDRMVALNERGDVLVAAGDLSGARKAYEESLTLRRRLAAQDQTSASAQSDVSVSLEKIGDVLVAAGDLSGARKAYEESLTLRRRLAAQDQTSASAQRDVSVSVEKLGDVLVAAGDLSGARKAYEEDLAIARSLAAQDQTSASAQRDLWVSLWRLAALPGSGVRWADVVAAMEKMDRAGTLFPADRKFLEQARSNAAKEKAQ